MRVARVNDNTIIEFSNYGVNVLGVKDTNGTWQVKAYLSTLGQAQAIDDLINNEPAEYNLFSSSAKTAIKLLTKLGRKITIAEEGDYFTFMETYKGKATTIVTQ